MSNPSELGSDSRSLSPWMVIGGVALLAVVGALVLALVAAALAPPPDLIPAGVAQAKLADGSVLVLHGITDDGKLEVPESMASDARHVFDRLRGRAPTRVTFYSSPTQKNALTIWLARYNGRTGQPLEFDRWSHSIVTTPAGTAVTDANYASRMTRRKQPHISTSSTTSSRPFAAFPPGTYSHVVYAASVPRVRSSTGDVRIDVYHADRGHVATMTAPLPGGPTSYPSWTPAPLPASAVDGDLEVTLTSLSERRQETTSSDGRTQTLRDVQVDFEVRQTGLASALWNSRQIWLEDALGNECSPYDCTLSADEAAWKIGVRLFRSDEAALLQGSLRPQAGAADGSSTDERLVIEDLILPDADPATTPNSTQTGHATIIDGVTVSLLGVGGPGKCQYRFKALRGHRGSYSMGEGIETEFEPPNATLTVDNIKRHIALKIEGDTADHRVSLLLTDQNGVRLKTDWPRQMEQARVWLFEADEWVTAVNVYITVQRARNVEFIVAPPQPAETQSDRRPRH